MLFLYLTCWCVNVLCELQKTHPPRVCANLEIEYDSILESCWSASIIFASSLEQNLKMGSSESKIAVVSTPRPDPIHRLKTRRLAELADPRSPSCGINRTPIQVTGHTQYVPVLFFSVHLNMDINWVLYPCIAVLLHRWATQSQSRLDPCVLTRDRLQWALFAPRWRTACKVSARD